MNSLISPDESWLLWGFLVGWAAISIYLEQRFEWASKLSGAIIALVGAMLLANFGVIPIESPTYDIVWAYVVPLAIPLLLFQSNIIKIWKESGRLLMIFLISSIGTAAGTIIAFFLLRNHIPVLNEIGAMVSASYTGGSVNFAAMATRFDVDGETVSSTVVADNLLMALYFLVLIAIPAVGFFRKNYHTPHIDDLEKTVPEMTIRRRPTGSARKYHLMTSRSLSEVHSPSLQCLSNSRNSSAM